MTVRTAELLDDDNFDRKLPHYERESSFQYWTPVAVAARAVAAFSAHRANRVLDVGSGAGKFCIVAGRLEPTLEIHGIEQRARLVRLARGLARDLNTPNVRFTTGDATLASWDQYDGLYFFNPFATSVLGESGGAGLQFSMMRLGSDLLRAETQLVRARVGTVLVTYCGFGGAIPSTYELVSDDRAGTDRVRTWVQRSEQPERWAWFETETHVVRVDWNHMHGALASLICPTPSNEQTQQPPRDRAHFDVYGASSLSWRALTRRRIRRW